MADDDLVDVTKRGDDWHRLRAQNVGGSEVAALFGLQPQYALSLYALWHIKAGNVPPPPVDGERIEWGLELEQVIAKMAAKRGGWQIRKGGYEVDRTTPGLGCTLDYIIDAPAEAEKELGFSGPGALELKNVDWLVHRRSWLDDEPPEHIVLQLQHQLAATGFAWGVVAALVGGNHLLLYRYAARPKIIDAIRERVTEFWRSIREKREPKPDGSSGAMHTIRHRFHPAGDRPVDMTDDNELPELCARKLRLEEQRKAAEREEDDVKAQIMAKLGNVRCAMLDNFFITQTIIPENPGRPPKPGELIGKRAEVRRLAVKEATR
jgi:predicted phage-related endonuclease